MDAENARLLDRLTKQQEINQSLRVENAQLKDWATTAQAKADKLESEFADYKRIAEQQEKTMRELRADIKLYTNGMSLEEWHDDMEQQKAEITDDAERDIAQLGADLAMKDKIILGLREAKYQLSIKKDAEHKAEVDKLKAELLDISVTHRRDTEKTCLKAKFDTWREEQVKYNPDYNMEDEAQWLVYEAGNIQDAIEVFNELYEDGTGDDYTWKMECDHERNWELDQWWMDEETGEYTLTEAEWEAQNQEDNDPEEYGEYTWKQGLTAEEIAKGDTINPETGEALTCDFCDKERKVLTKRDAGYDEWTCSTCHKEQYPEQYEEKQ